MGGYKWFSKGDDLRLNIGDLNFAKRIRGRKDLGALGVIPENLTQSYCQGKAAEIFDPMGLAVPITCGFKVDLKRLNSIGWDQLVSDEERDVWDKKIFYNPGFA